MKKVNYIIYVPEYEEDTGGIIVLYKLCELLRKLGENAYIWPAGKRIINKNLFINYIKLLGKSNIYHKIKNYRFRPYEKALYVTPEADLPIAGFRDLKNAVAIYPEIVSGNPLNCKRVVRWLLNKPGFFTGKTDFNKNDLFFYFQEAFNDQNINKESKNKLFILVILDKIYKQYNFNKREGICYILRKGKNRKIVHDLTKGTIIDGLGHKEVSEIFNKCEYCFSYDLYTFYSCYASMCGCKSIVVPEDRVSIEKWQPSEELRWGIAYGENDLERAISTRNMMIENLKKIENNNSLSVQHFKEIVLKYFRIS